MCEKMNTCNFCGKRQDQVEKLIAGPKVYICNQCVDMCTEICEEVSEKKEIKDKIFVVMNNGNVDMAALDSGIVLERIFEIEGNNTVKVFNGHTGSFIHELGSLASKDEIEGEKA